LLASFLRAGLAAVAILSIALAARDFFAAWRVLFHEAVGACLFVSFHVVVDFELVDDWSGFFGDFDLEVVFEVFVQSITIKALRLAVLQHPRSYGLD
jgi:hypothetical protein